MSVATRHFGLSTAPAVKWLLDCETDVRERVKQFIAGTGEAVFDVAGLPGLADILAHRSKPRGDIRLPCVRLHLRMIRHNLTDEPGVEVKCTDADLETIEQWRLAARFRRKESVGLAQASRAH